MATIALNQGKTLRPTRGGNTTIPYLVEFTLDLAKAATAKGSALAAGDVIKTVDLPAHSIIWGAGFEVLSQMTGSSTDATVDLGVTGIDPDVYVDGFDLDAGTVGTYSQFPAAYQPITIGGTASTLDLLIATQTGTITGGKLRIFAVVQDVKDRVDGLLAALKS